MKNYIVREEGKLDTLETFFETKEEGIYEENFYEIFEEMR